MKLSGSTELEILTMATFNQIIIITNQMLAVIMQIQWVNKEGQ